MCYPPSVALSIVLPSDSSVIYLIRPFRLKALIYFYVLRFSERAPRGAMVFLIFTNPTTVRRKKFTAKPIGGATEDELREAYPIWEEEVHVSLFTC